MVTPLNAVGKIDVTEFVQGKRRLDKNYVCVPLPIDRAVIMRVIPAIQIVFTHLSRLPIIHEMVVVMQP